MPAKKAPGSREAQKHKTGTDIKVEVPLNGLYMERYCAFPVWDSNEIEKENWLNSPADFNPNDPATYFIDQDSSHLGTLLFEGLDSANIEWKRPNVLFSPFKPVVYRPSALDANPYDCTDESEEGRAARDAAQASYRELRPLRAVGDEDEATARAAAAKSRVAAATAALTGGAASGTPRRGRGATATPVPFLMGAFQSALAILSQNQQRIAPGSFGWELIYPQVQQPQQTSPHGNNNAHSSSSGGGGGGSGAAGGAGVNSHNLPLPVVNPSGKYAVRLFVGGVFRKVIIDDRLPADSSGRSILTVTDYKEIWPALLAKAIMKVLGPSFEAQIALNPVVTLSTLMCGWTPQVLSPVADELLVYRMLQKLRYNEELVLVATCSDSAGASTCGAVGAATSQSLQLLAYESALQNKGLMSTTKDQSAALAASLSAGNNNVNNSSNAAGGDSNDSSSSGEKNKEGSESFYRTHRLRAFHGYHIVDMRIFGSGFLVRLYCPGANYTGPFSYDSDDWNSELIDGIGFNPAEHRNPNDIAKRWNDFWVSWDNFKEYFASFIVLRYAADRKAYPHFKSFPADVVVSEGVAAALGLALGTPGVVTVPGGIPAAAIAGSASSTLAMSPASSSINTHSPGNRRGGGGAGGSNARGGNKQDPNTLTLDIPAAPEVQLAKHQKTSTRWVHLKNTDQEFESSALIVLTGLPCPSAIIQAAVVPPVPTKGSKTGGGGGGGASAAAAAAAAAGQIVVTVPPASATDIDAEPQQWSVQVHRFDWAQSQPFTLLSRQTCHRGLNQSCTVVLPPGRSTTLRITVENAPIGCAVAVTSPCEITSGAEREVLLDGCGIVSGSDAGYFADHPAPSNIAMGVGSGAGGGNSGTGSPSSPSNSPILPGRGAGLNGSMGSGSVAGTVAAADEAAATNRKLAEKHTTPGQFSNPAALQSGVIWFKRLLVVKADTTASFILSTLPRDADVAAHRIVPQEAVQQGGKGAKKSAGGGASGEQKQQQSAADAAAQKQQGGAAGAGGAKRGTITHGGDNKDDDENSAEKQQEPTRSITDFVNLILVDVETGETTLDTIGKMLNVPLAPNKLGYILMAVARTPDHYRRGAWKLNYYSSRVFDTFESRSFDDVATRTGHYVQNDLRQVFRYNFCFPATNEKNEPVGPSATIQMCLRDDSGLPVPFSIELRHSAQDPAIASAYAAQTAAASGGASPGGAANMSMSLSASKSGKVSAAEMAAMTAAAASADSNGNTGDVVASRTASHYAMFEHVPLSAHEKNTPSYYSLVCVLEGDYSHVWEQRRKAQVIEGFKVATEKQERLLLQQQWTRYQALKRKPGAPLPRELEQPPPPVDIQPGNIVFTVSLHFSNSKYELKEDSSIADALSAVKQGWGRKEAEERAAALAVSSGKRQAATKKVNAKDEQQMTETIGAHFARAKEARERFLQNRKGIFLPYLNTETGQPVLDALSDPTLRFVPLVPPMDNVAYESDPQRAAAAAKTEQLAKALSHATPTMYAKKLVEHTLETTAAIRAARRTWISHLNDTLSAHWAEVAPNKPLNGQNKDEQEQDDKRRRGAAGRVRR